MPRICISLEGPEVMPATHIKYHYDPNNSEWVIRVHHGDSFCSIGAMNGEQEAIMVTEVLQGALELFDAANRPSMRKTKLGPGMRNADNMVGGRGIVEFMRGM